MNHFLMTEINCKKQLPVLPGPEWVQFTGAAHGDNQQKPAYQAANCCRGDDLAGQDDGAVELVCSVLAVHLAVTAPALKHTPADGTMGRLCVGVSRNNSSERFSFTWMFEAEACVTKHYNAEKKTVKQPYTLIVLVCVKRSYESFYKLMKLDVVSNTCSKSNR